MVAAASARDSGGRHGALLHRSAQAGKRLRTLAMEDGANYLFKGYLIGLLPAAY
jgi:hypothetical protein